jgi:hypothetical protein
MPTKVDLTFQFAGKTTLGTTGAEALNEKKALAQRWKRCATQNQVFQQTD